MLFYIPYIHFEFSIDLTLLLFFFLFHSMVVVASLGASIGFLRNGPERYYISQIHSGNATNQIRQTQKQSTCLHYNFIGVGNISSNRFTNRTRIK